MKPKKINIELLRSLPNKNDAICHLGKHIEKFTDGERIDLKDLGYFINTYDKIPYITERGQLYLKAKADNPEGNPGDTESDIEATIKETDNDHLIFTDISISIAADAAITTNFRGDPFLNLMEVGRIFLNDVPFKTIEDTSDIFYFDKISGLWKAAEKRIEEGIIEVSKMGGYDRLSSHEIKELILAMKGRTYIERAAFDSAPKNLIPLKNGVYDIKTRELEPYKPEHYFTNCIPVRFNPGADCPRIKSFLKEITASVEDAKALEEIAGYTLYRNYFYQKAFMLTGEGNNGKSVYLDLIRNLAGKEFVSTIALQEFSNNRFAASGLYRKTANIYADLSSEGMKETGLFKALTGGDEISAECKFKNPFKFQNYAKLVFSCNKVPFTWDESNAYYRRWHLIPFPKDFEKEGCLDLHLREKLNSEQELEGFLLLALAGLARLLKNGKISGQQSAEKVREQYLRASEPIGAFSLDCLCENAEGEETKEAVYAAFSLYCKEKRLILSSAPLFAKRLGKFMPEAVPGKKTEYFDVPGEKKKGKKQVPVWRGISLDISTLSGLSGQNPTLSNYSNPQYTKKGKSPDTPDTPAIMKGQATLPGFIPEKETEQTAAEDKGSSALLAAELSVKIKKAPEGRRIEDLAQECHKEISDIQLALAKLALKGDIEEIPAGCWRSC